MKNGSGYIRQQLYSSLGSVGIPVFEEGEALAEEEYIVLGHQLLTEDNDKRCLNDRFRQIIEVVVANKTKKRLDELGLLVMNAVDINDSVDFQIIGAKRESQDYVTELSAQGGIMRRLILTYSFLLIQR